MVGVRHERNIFKRKSDDHRFYSLFFYPVNKGLVNSFLTGCREEACSGGYRAQGFILASRLTAQKYQKACHEHVAKQSGVEVSALHLKVL